MPVFTDALLGDTLHLSAEEFGAYCLLLFATWRNNGVPLPDDDAKLARICRVTRERWSKRLRPNLVSFFDISGGSWRQKRLEKEWKHTQETIERMRENAKARWLKQKNGGHANASPPHMQTACTHPHTQEDSVSPNGDTGAGAPSDPIKDLFDRGKALLGPKGGSVLGKMRKEYGDVAVMAAISACERNCVSDPVAYMNACLNGKAKGNGRSPSAAANLFAGFAQAAGYSGAYGEADDPLLDRGRPARDPALPGRRLDC